MNVRERSLRDVVESWFGSEAARRVRITRFRRARSKPWRHVCIEVERTNGALSLVFFLHDNGSWCVFPPEPRVPAMGFGHHGEYRPMGAYVPTAAASSSAS